MGDSVQKTLNPAHTMHAAKARRHKGGGRGKRRAAAAPAPPKYIETPLPSVVVDWFDAGEGISSVFLVADKYNRGKVIDGWVVVEQDKLVDSEDSMTALEKLEQEALEKTFLCDVNMWFAVAHRIFVTFSVAKM